jgi:uncharacterized protein YceK
MDWTTTFTHAIPYASAGSISNTTKAAFSTAAHVHYRPDRNPMSHDHMDTVGEVCESFHSIADMPFSAVLH